MPAYFVEKWFRLLVYPKRLQASLGYTQSRNHCCTTLLQLVTWLNNRGHFQVSQGNTTHRTQFFKWSDTTTTMVLFFARRQALMNTKWFRLWVYPKLACKRLGYNRSRNHVSTKSAGMPTSSTSSATSSNNTRSRSKGQRLLANMGSGFGVPLEYGSSSYLERAVA